MARNLFKVHLHIKPQILTINEIAIKVYSLLLKWGEVDSRFFNLSIYLSYNSKKTESIDLLRLEKTVAIQKLAESILAKNLNDIRQYDKIKHPTIDYYRDFGFSFLCEFGSVPNNIDISFRVASNNANYIDLGFNYDNKEGENFTWYFNILNIAVQELNIESASVKIANMVSFTNEYSKYNFSLGWISYFSKELELKIPDNIEGITYKYIDKGTYLILTKDDFTIDKESFVSIKAKLFDTMKFLGEAVPGYLRREEK